MKGILILITALTICSCTTRALDELNSNPSLNFREGINDETEFSDSVKISIKSQQEYTEITLVASDENADLESLSFTSQGNVIVIQDGIEKQKELNLENSGSFETELKIYPQTIGQSVVTFVATDAFGETSSVNLNITSFNNLNPIASLKVTKIGIEDDRHYYLDASGSYDQDQNYGGGINVYEYFIDDQKITMDVSNEANANRIDFIFGESGIHNFRLRVMDTDGQWDEIEFVKNIN